MLRTALAIDLSTSLRNELRRPCRFLNSEFGSRDNGFEPVRSKIDGPSAFPTYQKHVKFIKLIKYDKSTLTSSKIAGVYFGTTKLLLRADEFLPIGGNTFTYRPVL